MAQQIKKKFLAPEVIDYFDNQIESVDQKIDQEILDRQDAVQGLQDQITNLGDGYATDAELASAVSALELADSNEALARENADNALDLRIDALEAFGPDQIIHVSKNGSDTNSGKQHSPFLTITAAQNAILDASPSKRYAILVAPGSYTEASIALKANVFIVGLGNKESVRITGPVTMGSSFSGSGDHRSGFNKVTLLSAADFNWQTVTSAAGKLYMSEVVFGSTLNMYGHNNAIAQAQFSSCVIFGVTTISGINVGVFTNNVTFQNINLVQHPNTDMATVLSATGGNCGGDITLTAPVDNFGRRCSAFLRGFWSENLIVDGPSAYADVDLVSGSKQGAQKLNNGQVVALNPVISHDLTTQMIVPRSSNSHNMGDWGKQWTWSFGWVHASTGTDLYLISYPESFSPDSSGKSIIIAPDGAGLQENVDGGEIILETAAVTGTGIKGKIQLNGRLVDVSSTKIINVADGVDSNDAVNKSQLDGVSSALQSNIDVEKGRIDAILLASDADKDSFKEIVDLINSVDTENDNAFGAYVISNDAALAQEIQDRIDGDAGLQLAVDGLDSRVDALEAKGFSKGSQVIGANLEFIDLDRQYSVILSVAVGRLALHEGEDYTVSVVGGVTRLTWIGSIAHPDGAEKIETGDKVFYAGAY